MLKMDKLVVPAMQTATVLIRHLLDHMYSTQPLLHAKQHVLIRQITSHYWYWQRRILITNLTSFQMSQTKCSRCLVIVYLNSVFYPGQRRCKTCSMLCHPHVLEPEIIENAVEWLWPNSLGRARRYCLLKAPTLHEQYGKQRAGMDPAQQNSIGDNTDFSQNGTVPQVDPFGRGFSGKIKAGATDLYSKDKSRG